MTRLVLLAALVAPTSHAQDPAQPPPSQNAAITGTVKDSVTGKPLANYTVSTDVNAKWVNNVFVQNSKTREVTSTTDESGRYRLSDLPPGDYRLAARENQHFGSEMSKRVTLAGHDLDNFDFRIVVNGTISGKVVDENNEPVPDMMVLLVSKEYFLGSVGYFLKSSGRTNDRGKYKIARINAGHPYLLLAEKRAQRLPAHSEAPLNPKLRRRAPMRTWYLNSPAKEGAVAITLHPGEDREGVNIEVKKSPSYCIDGALSTPSGPAALNFYLEPQTPSSGISAGGGMFMMPPNGVTGADGKFRICDLYPGSYRLTAMQYPTGPNSPPSYYGVATLTVSDRDISGLKIAATAGTDLDGEVVLDGPPPATPITAKVSASPEPRLRSHYSGEDHGGRYEIPGAFSWKGLLVDDYAVRAFINSPGLYIKDITYADRSVMYEPLQLGTALGNAGVKVIIGQDGATLSVRVADKDSNPVPDLHVYIMPAEVPSEGVLAARLVNGQTDQAGQYTSSPLPPGKYYAAATAETFDATEESIAKLWRTRNHFKEVILPPNGSIQVALEPM